MFVQDATNVSVPEYVDVMSELQIIPGCTYEIIVEANPNDGKRKASLKYTVPGRSILGVVGYAVKSNLPLRIESFGKMKVKGQKKGNTSSRYRRQNS